MSQMRAVGVIPARYGSERFPGKVLREFRGKSLLRHTYESARRSRMLSDVVIATDHAKIAEAAAAFGARTVMTSPECRSGSDRAAEAARSLDAEIIVNIQADEPFMPRDAIEEPLKAMRADPAISCATAATKIRAPGELLDPNVVKVVLDRTGDALYFSRSLIPCPRGDFDEKRLLRQRKVVFYKHVGIYHYRKDFLLAFARMPSGYLEGVEKLEQLRILEGGVRMRVVVTATDSPCVDTLEDLARLG